MKYLLFILCCFPAVLCAQEDKKYLEGAVPEKNGKVVFSRDFNVPGYTQDQIFKAALLWSEKRFITDEERKGRILYSNQEKGEIANMGEEYLTFTRKALALDRAVINYRMIILCKTGECKAEITAIHYKYNMSGKVEVFPAEDMITDEYTLRKKKDKLLKTTGKFRIKTIDMVDELFEGLATALGISSGTPAPSAPSTPKGGESLIGKPALPQVAPPTPVAPSVTASNVTSSSFSGYKPLSPDKIPGNIYKMLSDNWMLITAGNDEKFNMMTASWGGLGHLYNKPVAFCFINPARYTYQLMEKGDIYTLSFYTETYRDALNYCGHNSGKTTDKVKGSGLTPITTPSGGKAFAEAWMIIECKKLVSQSFTPEAIQNKEQLKEEWLALPMHRMYIGEIINVWVK